MRALRAVHAEGVLVGEDVRAAMKCGQTKAYMVFAAIRDLRILEPTGTPETWRVGPRSKAWLAYWDLRL